MTAGVPPPPPPPPAVEGVTDESKLFGLIAWLLGIIGAIIAIVLKKDDKFVMFHAKQSLTLWIGVIVIDIAVMILSFVLSLLRLGILTLLFGWLPALIGLIGLIITIIGALKAYGGEWWKAPIIGDIAEKIPL
ncbi:MAG: hypothetical protein DRJ37_01265 [Thermoprotei archaeon]|nr:MAG: hypothetical protein DRJ37_01265 [Thermoprotei archaeon]